MVAVRKLTRDEKIALRAYLGSLINTGSSSVAVETSQSDGPRVIVAQLLRFLISVGANVEQPSAMAIDRVVTSPTGKGALPKFERLWEFITAHASKRFDREALLQVGFRCQYDQLCSWMDSVGLNEMLRNIDTVATSLDANFPGYAESGMLGFVVQQRRSNT
jgi:hypothetical protein